MSPKIARVTALTLLVVALIAAAIGTTYALQERRMNELRIERDSLLTANRQQEKANQDLAERLNQLTAQAPGVKTTQTVPTAAPPVDAEQSSDQPGPVRQFAFVSKATENGGVVKLSLNYAQFLTGDAAAKAAQDAGGESPPPNDFYIVDTDSKVRALPVSPKAKFTIVSGGPDETTVLSTRQFVEALAENTEGASDAPYWFTIDANVVTGGEQQWTP